MNTFTFRLLVTLLFTSPAFAASSVDLTVQGLITPSACTLAMPSAVDYGKISAKDLSVDRHTKLEVKTLPLTISCEAKTLFAIKPIENRRGSATSVSYAALGLGLINDTEKLGYYFLVFQNPVAEIPSLMLNFSLGQWRLLYPQEAVIPDTLVALGNLQSDVGYLPHPVQNAAIEIELSTYIAPTSWLTLTHEVPLDGSATLELTYL